jgi:hypothetical protein
MSAHTLNAALFPVEPVTIHLAPPVPFRELLPGQKRHMQNIMLQLLPVGISPDHVAATLEQCNPAFHIYLRLPQFQSTESLIYILSFLL